jgi:hypothetical protein
MKKLLLLVIVSSLLTTACGGAKATVPNNDYARQTQAVVEKWIAAYQERDAQALLSLYSNDITETDCSGVECVTFHLSDLESEVPYAFRDPTFKVRVNSYVVTSAGVFASVQATYEYGSVGPTTPVPATIILEFRDGRILNEMWVY